jgi:hypothetical protein
MPKVQGSTPNISNNPGDWRDGVEQVTGSAGGGVTPGSQGFGLVWFIYA